MTPIEFQQLLMRNGYKLPRYGDDGSWGEETAEACESWFDDGIDLTENPAPSPSPGSGIVPADWMPDCAMERIIVHWTAGAYAVSQTDVEHYHIVVDGDGRLVRGDKSIKANVSTSDADGYAAHTKSCNSGSIGISAACMAGAIENPFDAGAYPLKPVQWETLAQVAAELCARYEIKVTPQTVLQHGEVEDNLGIAQDGKWDILKLSWEPGWSAADVGNAFRDEVTDRL